MRPGDHHQQNGAPFSKSTFLPLGTSGGAVTIWIALMTLRAMFCMSAMAILACWWRGGGGLNHWRWRWRWRGAPHRGQATGGGEADEMGKHIDLAVVDDACFVVRTPIAY